MDKPVVMILENPAQAERLVTVKAVSCIYVCQIKFMLPDRLKKTWLVPSLWRAGV